MLLKAATRGSPLALWQVRHVAALLSPHGVTIEEVVVSTSGDRQLGRPIHSMGGKGVFVKEIQLAVLDGRADIAVHSMKDVPSAGVPGLVLASVPARGNPLDALVGSRLSELAPGATVGTGSVRRRAQLAALRPDLAFEEIRGNIATRLDRVGELDAIVMAAAALQRLGLEPTVVDLLDPEVLLPQVGQGALAIETRSDDAETMETLRLIEDPQDRLLTDAERAFLAELGGDCDLPAGAYATTHPDGIRLRSLLAAEDGSTVLRDERVGSDAARLGREAARDLLAGGGRALLES